MIYFCYPASELLLLLLKPEDDIKTFSLLIFHGSARQSANEAAINFAQKLQNEAGCKDFALCFLKGASPELREAVAEAVAAGKQNIRLIPLFLLPGTHTTDDIPAVVKEFSLAHPEVKFVISDCLVNNPDFCKFVANALKI